MELQSLKTGAADLTSARLLFGFRVENPNDFELKVDGLRYELELGGKRVVQEEINQEQKVGGKQSTALTLPVTIRYADVLQSAAQILQGGTLPFRLKGTARVGILRIPFEEKGEVILENGKFTLKKER